MSYQVLARKWRPRTFESLVGQEHVVRALTHALNENRLHHAYLFTGTRGVGKTTLARILAKSLNCETGISATPCGVCSSCVEIDSGRFVDLLEVDAATNTKVDEMRQLLENAVYAPTRGRFKVYVIDEVHMLSNSAFNAMLKTLEEPPEHVKFILATTDPQKIPVTVLSRCLQFNLKQMTPLLIAGHLKHILEIEGVKAEAGGVSLISHSADGSMRDALSLLDQAIAHGAGRVEEAQVREMLGTVDLDYLYSILNALLSSDVHRMLQVVDEMSTRSLSFDAALQDLASLLTRVQVAQLAPQAVSDDVPDCREILRLAECLDIQFVQLAYQIALHGRKELPLAPDERAGFVMTLLRLFAFRPAIENDPVEPRAISQAPKPKTTAPVLSKNVPMLSESLPDLEKVKQTEDKAVAMPEKPQPVVEPAASLADSKLEIGNWTVLLESLGVGGMARELGQHCELRRASGIELVLCLSPTHRHLQMKSAQDKLEQALSEHFGRSLRLVVVIDETSGETPAAAAQVRRRERQDQAVAAVEKDEFVREVIDLFDATLIESSIKPL